MLSLQTITSSYAKRAIGSIPAHLPHLSGELDAELVPKLIRANDIEALKSLIGDSQNNDFKCESNSTLIASATKASEPSWHLFLAALSPEAKQKVLEQRHAYVRSLLLHYAAKQGNPGLCWAFLSAHPNPQKLLSDKDALGRLPVEIAESNGNRGTHAVLKDPIWVKPAFETEFDHEISKIEGKDLTDAEKKQLSETPKQIAIQKHIHNEAAQQRLIESMPDVPSQFNLSRAIRGGVNNKQHTLLANEVAKKAFEQMSQVAIPLKPQAKQSAETRTALIECVKNLFRLGHSFHEGADDLRLITQFIEWIRQNKAQGIDILKKSNPGQLRLEA